MTDDSELSEIAARNRSLWDERSAEYQQTHGGQLAASGGAAWGLWQIPEAELSALDDVAGHDVLEFGCGAAQWSIALHGQGARVTALDNSARQLEHARSLMAAAGAEFRLVHASAEATGLTDASFDIVFCDHGAMTFADPHRTIPEAARLLRIGGLLAFSMHTPILDMAWEPEHDHPSDWLSRNYWELHACRSRANPSPISFATEPGYASSANHGFVVEDLLELRPPVDAKSSYRDDTDRDWARRWPMEHIWRVRRAADPRRQ